MARLGLRRAWRSFKRHRKERERAGSFRPRLTDGCDHEQLITDAARLAEIPVEEARRSFNEYALFHRSRQYERRLGECKTLCFEEAFLIYLFLSLHRPRTIVEIGTQYGKSTRRLLDMVERLGTGSEVVCFDVVDRVRHFDPREARLLLRDVTGTFTKEVLESLDPGLIYLDAHPYALLKSVIGEYLAGNRACVMSIHDCAPGLCNPDMRLDKSDPEITSRTGTWERWALAELFHIAGPLDPCLDAVETPTHLMKIFSTRHGLGVIVPRILLPLGAERSAAGGDRRLIEAMEAPALARVP
jgi:hypothetical protein